jgi:hypothetical protein
MQVHCRHRASLTLESLARRWWVCSDVFLGGFQCFSLWSTPHAAPGEGWIMNTDLPHR